MRARNILALACLAGPLCAPIRGAEPTARRPLRAPLFSFDLASPSVNPPPPLASDILRVPGPVVEVPAANLNLTANDDLDGLSFANATVGPADTFVLTFSVDRQTRGAVPPDPGYAAQGFPFNVQHQAQRNQAAGDEFMTLTLFNRSGPLAGLRVVANNSLIRNEGDAGGVDYDAFPNISPEASWKGPIDDVDAGMRDLDAELLLQAPPWTAPGISPPLELFARLSVWQTATPPALAAPAVPLPVVLAARQVTVGDVAAGTARPIPPPFFSLRRGSPSIGPNSAADIFVDLNPNQPGGEVLYVQHMVLGLVRDDDIGAVIVFDAGRQFRFDNGLDQVIFTLARNSPTLLNRNLSPADLLTSQGFGQFNVYAFAQILGLRPFHPDPQQNDHVNMLDLARCTDVDACIRDWGIGYYYLTAP